MTCTWHTLPTMHVKYACSCPSLTLALYRLRRQSLSPEHDSITYNTEHHSRQTAILCHHYRAFLKTKHLTAVKGIKQACLCEVSSQRSANRVHTFCQISNATIMATQEHPKMSDQCQGGSSRAARPVCNASATVTQTCYSVAAAALTRHSHRGRECR
jgi:hypothetical protein